MNITKNIIFLTIGLHAFVASMFAMHNDAQNLWVKKTHVALSEEAIHQEAIRQQKIQSLVSALINQDCSNDKIAMQLLMKGYAPNEIRAAQDALQTSQTGAYLTFDEVKAAIVDYNKNVKINVCKILITALRKILAEQKLSSLSTRVKHPTDEMVIEWFQRNLYTPKLSEQSLERVYQYYQDDNFVKSLWLLQTRDLGRYLFYNTQARLNGTDKEHIEPQLPLKKRKFESLNNNNNNNNHHNQAIKNESLNSKKIRINKADVILEANKVHACRFDNCTTTALSESTLRLHYLSSNHRACPYGNCDKTNEQRMNIAELKQHLQDAHSNESKDVYFCETCNFVGIIGSSSRRHEDGKKHKELN